jgi:hypothetical protein
MVSIPLTPCRCVYRLFFFSQIQHFYLSFKKKSNMWVWYPIHQAFWTNQTCEYVIQLTELHLGGKKTVFFFKKKTPKIRLKQQKKKTYVELASSQWICSADAGHNFIGLFNMRTYVSWSVYLQIGTGRGKAGRGEPPAYQILLQTILVLAMKKKNLFIGISIPIFYRISTFTLATNEIKSP